MDQTFSRLAVAGLIVLLALTGCKIGGGDDADEDVEETPPIPVEVADLSRGDVSAVYSGTASLEAEQEAFVVAKVAGEVIAIEVEEGDQVKAGDVLARLDGDRLKLELNRARANLRKLEQDYRRQLELHDKGLISAGAFEGLKFELDAQRAAYELSQLELSYIEIRAPIDGVVTERLIKRGNTLTINQQVFRIVDLDPLRADLFVPERELARLKAGQVATINIDALPGKLFSGQIARISPVVDPRTGTFKATVEVSDEDGVLKPGMFARCSIVYDVHRNSLLVPRAAIVDDEGQSYVYVVEEGVASRRVIATSYESNGFVEVTNGLTDSDRVIVVGQTSVKDGGEVAVVGEPEPANGDSKLATEQKDLTDAEDDAA